MRIGTWNVEYAKKPEKNLRRLARLRSCSASVWVLTETHADLDLSESHQPVSSLPRPDQRHGSHWVTIWSEYPVLEIFSELPDPLRSACALLDSPSGPILVLGVVLPWHTDRGDHPTDVEVKNWSEHHRVLENQAAEWSDLRRRYTDAAFYVSGDLNMSIGGPPYYGTARGRTALHRAMSACQLACTTSFEKVPAGMLEHPAIDHVLVPAAVADHTGVVCAWPGTDEDGIRLSDHSGLVVQVEEPKEDSQQ
jgi:hypothetical protein